MWRAVLWRLAGAGVSPADFEEILGGTVEMLSTNIDRTGRPFVSTFEAKSYPFCAHNSPPPHPASHRPIHIPAQLRESR